MSILSGLFGGGNGSSNSNTEADSSDFTSDFDAVLGINASNTSYESYSDGDESYESLDSQEFGLNLDIGNLIESMTDSFSESDSVAFG
jgi:hypothetical protein